MSEMQGEFKREMKRGRKLRCGKKEDDRVNVRGSVKEAEWETQTDKEGGKGKVELRV